VRHDRQRINPNDIEDGSMVIQDIWIAFKSGLLPVAIAILLGTLPIYIAARLAAGLKVRGQIVYLLAFGALGGLLGYSAGASQQSIIGTVLPTLLTLITFLMGYIFSKDSLPHLKDLIPFCLLVLILNSFLCLFIGGRVKRVNAEYERRYNEWLMHYERVDLEVEKAQKLKQTQSSEAK
jgi:hypothetical protein